MSAATADKPAADIAAQVATALALLGHYFRSAPGAGAYMRGKLADECETKAVAAYAYAKAAFAKTGSNSTCSASAAAANCIGSCAGTATPVRMTMTLAALRLQLLASDGQRVRQFI